jgi:hypothetical protein
MVLRDSLQQCFDRGAGEGLGEWLGQLGASDQLHGVGGKHLTGIEEGAQHIPGGPAAADRRGFMITRVGGERGPHRVLRYVNHPEPSGIAGDERRDRNEVLPVGLHRVRRGLVRLAVIQELGEPLRDRIDHCRLGVRITADRGSRRGGVTSFEHVSTVATKDGSSILSVKRGETDAGQCLSRCATQSDRI